MYLNNTTLNKNNIKWNINFFGQPETFVKKQNNKNNCKECKQKENGKCHRS